MGLLACRGPVHAPSLVWGAGGGTVDLPPSSELPRLPRGGHPRSTSAGARRRCYYDLRYDPARSPGIASASREHQPKSAGRGAGTSARAAQSHRLKVVSGLSHYRAEKHEILQGPHAAGADSTLYAPVYFTLPGFPAVMDKSCDGGMDKWDSARVLHRSRPVAAVLRHIEEQRYLLSPGGRSARVAPLFDQQAHAVAPARLPQAQGRGRGSNSQDIGESELLASNIASSSYMHCISISVGMSGNVRPRTSASGGSHSRSSTIGGYRAPRSAPALIGYKPVYISDNTTSSRRISSSLHRNGHMCPSNYGTRSTQDHGPTSFNECGGFYRQKNIEPNHSAFMVSCTGREGRSHRTVASSRSCGYGGASGRAHCRALYSSQAGYMLGWVRRRNADEHAAAAKIQALFRGRYDFERLLACKAIHHPLTLIYLVLKCVRRL